MKNSIDRKECLFDDFKKYIYKNRYIFMMGIVIFFIIYGKQLYNTNIRIDTEILINSPSSVYNWLGIGRQGAIFSRIIFEQLNFNPYFVTIVSFAIYSLSMVTFSYLFYYLGRMQSIISVLIFLIFLVHPIWMEQFYFTLQVVPISVGVFLTSISVFITFWSIINKNILGKIIAVILMVWIFSTYQLFMILYVATSIFSFLLLYNYSYSNQKNIDLSYIKLIIQLVLLFFIAMIINTIITKMFFSGGYTYLANQTRWSADPIEICIKNIIGHFMKVVLGKGIFYSLSYIISAILMLSALIYSLADMKSAKFKLIYILAGVGFQICPFLLTIYSGSAPAIRAQFVLPFIIASNLGMTISIYSSIRRIKKVIWILPLIIFMAQTQMVMRLQYTDDIRFQEDIDLAINISQRISEVTNGEDKPVVFVGAKQSELNAACVKGELIGKSIFQHDEEVEPHYWHSSKRIIESLQTVGLKMENILPDQMVEARKIANEMQVWPYKNSVYDTGDFVIVKLSEDIWYSEDIMEPKIEKAESKSLIYNLEVFRYSIDSVNIEDNILTIQGWILENSISSKNRSKNVYILDEDNGDLFKLATSMKLRPDLNNAFPSKVDYSNSGFIAKAYISDLNSDFSKYRIILGLDYGEDEKLINTEIRIKESY